MTMIVNLYLGISLEGNESTMPSIPQWQTLCKYIAYKIIKILATEKNPRQSSFIHRAHFQHEGNSIGKENH